VLNSCSIPAQFRQEVPVHAPTHDEPQLSAQVAEQVVLHLPLHVEEHAVPQPMPCTHLFSHTPWQVP
jgi:hypothetical protein